MHRVNTGVRGGPLRNGERARVLPLHPHVESLEPALEHPRGERIGRLTPYRHLCADFVDDGFRAADDAGEYVMMAMQVLRR